MVKNWRVSVLPALLLLVLPVMSMAQVGINISVNLAPPELPVYEQPAIPAEGYLWTPGYWAWSGDYQGYYCAGHVGSRSAAGIPLDSGVLGQQWRRLCME
jgi:hypothetical protein